MFLIVGEIMKAGYREKGRDTEKRAGIGGKWWGYREMGRDTEKRVGIQRKG